MTTRKTATRSTSSSKRPAKHTSPRARRRFTLQLGTGFSFVTETVEGGELTTARVVGGSTLSVRYWKDPRHPAHPSAALARITLHARLDGAVLPAMVLAEQNALGQLIRGAAQLELAETAKLLEYWFELTTQTGETLWDSNFGHNHWLELASAAMVNGASDERRAEA